MSHSHFYFSRALNPKRFPHALTPPHALNPSDSPMPSTQAIPPCPQLCLAGGHGGFHPPIEFFDLFIC